MLLPILVFAICFISSMHGEKLHEHMTKEEIQSVFNCKHDAIHEVEYEVVPIFHRENVQIGGRKLQKVNPTIHLKAFNQNYTLYLEKNDHVLLGNNTPVFIAKNGRLRRSYGDESSIIYSRIQYPLPESFKLYHDMENRAAVTVHRDDNKKVHVDGVVGDDIVIRPLPARVHDEVLTKHPSLTEISYGYKRYDPFRDDPFSSSSFSNDPFSEGSYQSTHHVVIKPSNNVNNPIFGSMDNQWNQIKKQWINNQLSDSTDSFDSWQNTFKRPDTGRPVFVPYVTWRPTQVPFAWRPPTNEPVTWWRPPVTKKPVTWWHRPVTKEPVTWWRPPVTKEPVTWWRPPVTKEPVTWWRPPVTEKPVTWWRPPVTKEPVTRWRQATRKPVTLRPSTEKPVTRFPTRVPTTSHPAPIPSTPSATKMETVYPQLLITVDYETYTTHGSNVETLAKYMAAFWNAVDLRFRELSRPNVRLNIAGLIIPQQPNSASYMENNRAGSKTVLADKTLTEIGKYFAKENKFPKEMYDIVVGVSHRNLGDYNEDGSLRDSITGIAMFAAACRTEDGHSVALVRDKGGFNGITTAAHELAHTMGAPHDGPESATVPGGPCAWNDGYLMSYERKSSNGVHWSQCSMTAMREFFRKKESKCLRNKPDPGIPYPKILPGSVLSRDEQCKRSMGRVSYKAEENNCATLWCAKYMDGSVSYNTEYRPPAEGTSCGEGAICLNAECVKGAE